MNAIKKKREAFANVTRDTIANDGGYGSSKSTMKDNKQSKEFKDQN